MAKITGTSGNDSLSGKGEDDYIRGLDGNDTLHGGAGNDSVFGGAGDDLVVGDEGNDKLDGGSGNDTLHGQEGDDTLHGGGGNDNLRGSLGNDSLSGDAGQDTLVGGEGNDTLDGGSGNDTLYGQEGDDTLDGGSGDDYISGSDGNDILYGGDDVVAPAERVSFKWDDIPDPDNGSQIDRYDSIRSGTQSVNGVEVSYDVTPGIGRFESDTQYIAGIDDSSETINGNSALDVRDTGTIEIGFSQEVENVEFRVNNFDSYQENLVIRAFDSNGNQIPFNFATGSNVGGVDTDAVAGADTFEGLGGEYHDDDPEGSLLVQIPGPVARIEMDFTSVDNWTLTFTDIYFDDPETGPEAGGDDTLSGGAGHDIIDGGTGNDSITGGSGHDTITTGTGDDRVVLQQFGGSDVITDFDIGDADLDGASNDQINVSELRDLDGNPVNIWDVVVSDDGNGNALLTFPQGETLTLQGVTPAQMTGRQMVASGIPCYAPGTLIDTPDGPRPVESLQPGDLVETVDNGPQPIRWIHSGDQPLEAVAPDAKPVLIAAGALGPDRPTQDLIVSPQHRMIVGGGGQLDGWFKTEAFAPAKSLAAMPGIRHMNGKKSMTWIHFACDRHEVVIANGCLSETLLLGPMVQNGLTSDERSKLAAIYGHAATPTATLNGPAARTCLKVGEVKWHLARCKKDQRRRSLEEIRKWDADLVLEQGGAQTPATTAPAQTRQRVPRRA